MSITTEDYKSVALNRRQFNKCLDFVEAKRLKMDSTYKYVKKLKRSDLEKIVLQKIVDVKLANCNLGVMGKKLDHLTADYMGLKKKCSALQKQVSDLQKVTRSIKIIKYTKTLRIPKIVRTVGVQVAPVIYHSTGLGLVNSNLMSASTVIDLLDDSSSDISMESSVNDGSVKFEEIEATSTVTVDTAIPKPEGKLQHATEVKDGDRENFSASSTKSDNEPVSLVVSKSIKSDRIIFALKKNIESFETESIINYVLEVSEKRREVESTSNSEWITIAKGLKTLPIGCHMKNFKTGALYSFRVKIVMSDKVFYSTVSSIEI